MMIRIRVLALVALCIDVFPFWIVPTPREIRLGLDQVRVFIVLYSAAEREKKAIKIFSLCLSITHLSG
jgi:hypothetical protein